MALSLNVLTAQSTNRQLAEMFEVGATRDISHVFKSFDEAERFLKEQWIIPRREGRRPK